MGHKHLKIEYNIPQYIDDCIAQARKQLASLRAQKAKSIVYDHRLDEMIVEERRGLAAALRDKQKCIDDQRYEFFRCRRNEQAQRRRGLLYAAFEARKKFNVTAHAARRLENAGILKRATCKDGDVLGRWVGYYAQSYYRLVGEISSDPVYAYYVYNGTIYCNGKHAVELAAPSLPDEPDRTR